jgi:hypothetical protein
MGNLAKVNYQALMDELMFTAVNSDKGYYDQLSAAEKEEHDDARKSLAEAQGIVVSSEDAYRSTFLLFKVRPLASMPYSGSNRDNGKRTNR